MATTPTDILKNYLTARVSVPQTPYTQEQSERYSAEADDGNDGEYSRKRREEEEEPVPTREEYEKNQREAEAEIEYNSQQELDDLDESASYHDDNDNHLEGDEFSGNYFSQPDENEPKESLGDRIRKKYDSFKASASDTAESLSSTFGESFGAAAGAASAKYSRFKRGDPIFSMQQPAKRGKNPYTRSVSRPGRTISRPYIGGRFGDSFSLGTNAGYNPYYPVNEGRQSVRPNEPRDLYLPSGTNPYEGEFSGRNAFKQSEFSDERKRYDPFGFGVDGRLSADGFNNMSEFGDSLLGGVGNSQESSIFGGMSAGTDTVFGDGAMFNANRIKGKKESSGFGLDMIIGNNGGMFNTIDPSARKTTTKRKSASTRKTAKKATKKPSTKRKSARKQPHNGFVLP